MDSKTGQVIERTFSSKGRSHHIYEPHETDRGYLKTSDQTIYQRDHDTQVIRRVVKKVRGKAARRADKAARREARCQSIVPSAAKT